MRRARVLGVLLALAATVGSAKADPWPVIEEPVLRPDSRFTKTSWGYQRNDLVFDTSRPWPVALYMEGYAGASRGTGPNAYLRMDDGELMSLRILFGRGARGDYVEVNASTRGTECSGGSFNLYDRRHAWDGYHIIEWLGTQPWSNGNVGMYGSSFPGQTAYFVASTQPPHLKAVSANLLHSDIYRDIFMVGGVQNYLFPTIWTYGTGPNRLPEDSTRNQYMANDEICAQNQATRYSAGDVPQPQNEPAWAALRSVDDQWYQAHAALTYAPSIRIPYFQQANWQDEQTGPRAAVLWNHIHPDPVSIKATCTAGDNTRRTIVPKKFVFSSGDHGYGNFSPDARWAFFDMFLLDRCDATGLFDRQVVNYFETDENGNLPTIWTTTKSGDSWPFEGTRWTEVWVHADGKADFSRPTGAEEPDTFVSGVPRQNWFFETPNEGSDLRTARGLPDVVSYETAALQDTMVVAGPVMFSLYASMAGTDADFFVSVSDVFPDGRVSYVQRGMLKASHRRVDPLRSYYDQGRVVQPYRPHTNPQPVQPAEVIRYDIELFPLAYIFRPGHRILIQVSTPPAVDGLWGYTPTHHQPAAVTILHDADHPSHLLLPVVTPDAPVSPASTTPCPLPAGFPCVPRSALDL